MKKYALTLLVSFCTMAATAQPRPFEIDESFIPSLEFMQKLWMGEYDGLEPNSRMIISIKRTLVLNPDLTYSNEVSGYVKNVLDEIVLKYETGTYQYEPETQLVTYTIDNDSTLDINIYLQGQDTEHTVNHYKQEGIIKTSSEKAQFTAASKNGARKWVLFDEQLISPIDTSKKAVYVMTETETSDINSVFQRASDKDIHYNLNGLKIDKPKHGLYVVNGKKVIM